MKTHLHSEQFDGHLHAACCRVDAAPGDKRHRIVGDDEFEATPKAERCRHCARTYWIHGGEE